MSTVDTSVPVRDRVMQTALDLFYRCGYRATGINELIEKSGVAKASFYNHFPSKESLLVAYVNEMVSREAAEMKAFVESQATPWERFVGPFLMLPPRFEQTNFRGCPFHNIVAEIAMESTAVKELAVLHRENIRDLVRRFYTELAEADPNLAGYDVEDVVATYVILYEGAIAISVAYHDPWPVAHAIESLKQYLAN